jgi:hypothetical protein
MEIEGGQGREGEEIKGEGEVMERHVRGGVQRELSHQSS